ncbi:MAG: TlyA family RNA methyltransferase [Actinomycetota bacterium]|jgi:23S rRNA (cytidine1920-2'-O)/16S rRNA (cytidine1409-2'-O)-methyltransferase
MTRRRLDAELVRRGLVSSREQGRAAIEGGRVSVSGVTATKAATQVDDAAPIELVAEPGSDFVSRGAHKLIGALEAFGLDVRDANALDAGASTGGFTQVLLQRGARHVIAVDVGYGQLAWSLRSDDRVTVLERTNVRHLDASRDELPYPPDLVVADLSFISLTAVLPALVTVAAPAANLVLMVKPQFEVGKERVGSGVVTSPDLRCEAVARVVSAAQAEKLAIFGVAASPLPGPKGNVEYFLWMGKVGGDAAELSEHDGAMEREDRVSAGPSTGLSAGLSAAEIESAIARAVQEGPQ